MRHLAFALLILSAGTLTSALAADTSTTQQVWDQHVTAATTGDLDTVMADFTEQSAIITRDGVIAGLADIRAFFEAFLAPPADGIEVPVTVDGQQVHGEIVTFTFTAGDRTFHDVALVRNGKIVTIATIDYPAE